MKLLKLSATLALLGTLTLGMAEATIDEQITAIQSASDEDRVELMNEFKENLSILSEEDRSEAITQLRSNMGGSMDGEQIQTRTQMRERSSGNYMEHTEDGQRMQQQMQQQKQDTDAQLMRDTNTKPTGKHGR